MVVVKGVNNNFFGLGDEHFSDYAHIFSRYFESGTSHGRILHDHEKDLSKNSILVITDCPRMDCEGCTNSSRKVNIEPLSGSAIPGSAFFDMTRFNPPCSRWDVVKYGDRIMGYYCPKNNILFTSDITHYGGMDIVVQYVFETMESKGLIKELVGNRRKREITLGADPEFESKIGGKLVSARNLPSLLTYSGCSRISRDGSRGHQRELRPSPSKDPKEVVENIKKLIKLCAIFGEDLTVRGDNYAIGGHIHLGGIFYTPGLITLFDYFLYPFTKYSGKARDGTDYGRFGDYRLQPHGLEYRTPPPVWLVTPKLATMTLELVKKIAEKHTNGVDINIATHAYYTVEKYKEDLKGIGFEDSWAEDFLKEIDLAGKNLDTPLAKMYGIEIPEVLKINMEDYVFRQEEDSELRYESPRSAPLYESEG